LLRSVAHHTCRPAPHGSLALQHADGFDDATTQLEVRGAIAAVAAEAVHRLGQQAA
jgi:hypothetical protein